MTSVAGSSSSSMTLVHPPESATADQSILAPAINSTSASAAENIDKEKSAGPASQANLPTPGPSRKSAPLPLSRTQTSTSIHTQNALRRMATHETGHGIDHEHDGPGRERGQDRGQDDTYSLHTHHEGEGEGEDKDSNLHSHDMEAGEQKQGKEGAEDGKKKKKKVVELQDQTNLLPAKQVITVFLGLTCALFCSLIDQTIVTTALPTLGRVFSRADIVSWVGTSYLLTSTAMQPMYGRLSDIFGRKTVLMGSIVIFWIGSLLCAISQSMIQLITFRAIQGIGGGGILTLVMIIISDVVSLKERGKYQGIVGVVVVTSNSIGPLIGGVFTAKVSWRWCFYINLPLTAISLLIVIFFLPLKQVHGSAWSKLKKIDYYGCLLTLAWVILVLLALSWGGNQYSWSSAAVLAPLVIGVALLVLFIVVETKLVPLPLIPFYILKNRTVAATMLSTLFSGCAFYSSLYYLPQFFQIVWRVSAIRSGVLLLPYALVQTLMAFVSGILVSKTGDYWWNMVVGFALWTIGLGLLSTIDPNSTVAKLAGYQIIVGIGAGQTFQTSLIAIQASLERKDVATATGLRNFLRMLGGTIALTVCSTIITNSVSKQLDGQGLDQQVIKEVLSDPTALDNVGLTEDQKSAVIWAYSNGLNACFWFLIPLVGISFFLTVFFVKKVPLKKPDDALRKEEGKAWVEERRAARRAKKGIVDQEAGSSTPTPIEEKNPRNDRPLEDTPAGERTHGKVQELEKDLEQVAESAGVQPAFGKGVGAAKE